LGRRFLQYSSPLPTTPGRPSPCSSPHTHAVVCDGNDGIGVIGVILRKGQSHNGSSPEGKGSSSQWRVRCVWQGVCEEGREQEGVATRKAEQGKVGITATLFSSGWQHTRGRGYTPHRVVKSLVVVPFPLSTPPSLTTSSSIMWSLMSCKAGRGGGEGGARRRGARGRWGQGRGGEEGMWCARDVAAAQHAGLPSHTSKLYRLEVRLKVGSMPIRGTSAFGDGGPCSACLPLVPRHAPARPAPIPSGAHRCCSSQPSPSAGCKKQKQ